MTTPTKPTPPDAAPDETARPDHDLTVRVWFALLAVKANRSLCWAYDARCRCGFYEHGWCCSRAEATLGAMGAFHHNCDDYSPDEETTS